MSTIPFQLGKRVDPNYSATLTKRLEDLLKTTKSFPGSKAIPFQQKHFELIETEDYFVCERTTAGKRLLLFFLHSPNGPSSFLLDRHQRWYYIPNLVFPVRTKEHEYLKDTVLDGELLLEKNTWKYRVFDMLVINGYVITQRSFNSRLGLLQQDVIQPFQSKYQNSHSPPITVELKKMELAYGLHLVLKRISAEQGIIWTPVKHPYTLGQSDKLLVWTPPELNRAFLRITAKWSKNHKAVYSLDVTQGMTYKFYAHFSPEDSLGLEWRDKLPFDRIAQFKYDPDWKVISAEEGHAPTSTKGGWRFLSFCDGKTKANNEETANNVVKQAAEKQGVSKEQLISHIERIRAAWKAREKRIPMPLEPPPSHPSLVEKSNQNVLTDTLDSPISLSLSNSSRPSSLSEQQDIQEDGDYITKQNETKVVSNETSKVVSLHDPSHSEHLKSPVHSTAPVFHSKFTAVLEKKKKTKPYTTSPPSSFRTKKPRMPTQPTTITKIKTTFTSHICHRPSSIPSQPRRSISYSNNTEQAPLQFINFHAEKPNPTEHVFIIRSQSHTNQPYTSMYHQQQQQKTVPSVKSKLDFILN